MADDDLLLTNKYTDTSVPGESDNVLFEKLIKSKELSKQLYSENNPDFTKEISVNQNTGLTVNENSPSFEQYLQFAQTDKKKKIKKTILNIDSRNRTKTYLYDSLDINISNQLPLHFQNNSQTFLVNTGYTNFIDNLHTYNQVILLNLSDDEFYNNLGIEKSNFEFNNTIGEPIFNVVKFIYNDGTKDIINSYNPGYKKFQFNKLELNIPHNIELKDLKTCSVGSNVLIKIITNVQISYPTPSHYFINLGKTFSNIYSIKLISSEIPNTSYTFNENLVTTNFGQFSLQTNQNNKLRWINKTDRVNIPSNNINMASLFKENMPFIPNSSDSDIYNKNFQILERLCNISGLYDTNRFLTKDELENMRRLYSLIRVSNFFDIEDTNKTVPIKNRDYSSNHKYIGDINTSLSNTIIGITQNKTHILNDTVFTLNETLISKISKDLQCFYHFDLYLTDLGDEYNSPYSLCQFSDNYSFEIQLKNNAFDYIDKYLYTLSKPFKIILYAQTDDFKYIFNVSNIVKHDVETSYTFHTVPINGDFTTEPPFKGYNYKVLMTVCNPISSNVIFNYQKYYPDIWTLLKNYYLSSDICMSPTNITGNYKYTNSTDNIIQNTNDNTLFTLEYKTYYTFSFVNTAFFQQVEEITTSDTSINPILKLYYLDKDANSVSKISSITQNYSFIKILNNRYIVDTSKPITFTNQFYSIPILNTNSVSTNHNIPLNSIIPVEFQKKDNTELQFLYAKNTNLSNHILRIYNDTSDFGYIEYFVSSDISSNSNFQKYEVRFKNRFKNIDILNTLSVNTYITYKESSKIHMREFIGDYIVTELHNQDPDISTALKTTNYLLGYSTNITGYNENPSYYSPSGNSKITGSCIVKYYERYLTDNTYKSDIIDIPNYLIVSITDRNIKNGINEISFAKEFVETTSNIPLIIYPKINSTTNKISDSLTINTDNQNTFYVQNNKIGTKYPIYELNISSGKYTADSIIKYMLNSLSNLKSRTFDYSKGIFYTDSNFQKFVDLNNEYGINQESKFIISVNKSVNSILFKQYKKIFDAHKNTSVVKGKIAYYNEGFPYIYINVPQISLINNSIVYLSGGGTLANISGNIMSGEKTVIIPPNYKIQIRQLLPLPKIDSIKNTQNLFTKEGYVDVTDNEIYNKYVDFINSAVSDNNTKDISIDYIIKRIFGIGESNYCNINDLSEDKFNHLSSNFEMNGISLNQSNLTEGNLHKSFVDNYGNNKNYESCNGYNNEKTQLFTSNKTGIEYYGQAMINGYNNEQPYKEYLKGAQQTDSSEEYGDEIPSGFETTFIQNELFMKLSDVNVTHKKNIIGKFTKISRNSDKYGNVEADYDLFTDNFLNFKIGDIIIGLDSNTIGIILPYDYKYNSLPNLDIITLGIGSYLMNKTVLDSGTFIEKYLSFTDNLLNRDLAKKFISHFNSWQIEKNNTNRGFYIYSRVTPNASKLSGTTLPNLQIYQPRFFKFLEGDDTALPKFGLVNSNNNNSWNYFKTNYETNQEVNIKRSFFNIAKNNDLYTDYLIFETKSIDNFNVNDQVNIENHQIIFKEGDFRREKFFNVKLMESYSSFISKLETIYNNSILNYNGLSGIGTITNTSGLDNKFLSDNEYKYNGVQGNSSAKAIAIVSASLKEPTITGISNNTYSVTGVNNTNNKYTLFTIPGHSFQNRHTVLVNKNVMTGSTLNTGNVYYVEKINSDTITLSTNNIINKGISSNSYVTGISNINNLFLTQINGRGYIGEPNVFVDNSIFQTETDNSAQLKINSSDINNGVITKITVTNRGESYSGIPDVYIDPPNITATIDPIISSDGKLANINLTNQGSGYTMAPSVTVSPSGVTATAVVDISGIGTVVCKNTSNTDITDGMLLVFSAPKLLTDIESEATAAAAANSGDAAFNTALINASSAKESARAKAIVKKDMEFTVETINSRTIYYPNHSAVSGQEIVITSALNLPKSSNNHELLSIGTYYVINSTKDTFQLSNVVNSQAEIIDINTISGTDGKHITFRLPISIVVYKSGHSYTTIENITCSSTISGIEKDFTSDISINVDAVGSVIPVKTGSNYSNEILPNISISSIPYAYGCVVKAVVNNNIISSYNVIKGGLGYNSDTTITIDSPRAIIKTKLETKSGINTGMVYKPINQLDIDTAIEYKGVGYNNDNISIEVSPPKSTAVAYIENNIIVFENRGKGYVCGSDANVIISPPQNNMEIINEIGTGQITDIIITSEIYIQDEYINSNTTITGITIHTTQNIDTYTEAVVIGEIADDRLYNIKIIDKGSGYLYPPSILFESKYFKGSNNTNLAYSVINNGSILHSTLKGSPLPNTTITFYPPFEQSSAIANIDASLIGFEVYQGGANYTEIPDIYMSDTKLEVSDSTFTLENTSLKRGPYSISNSIQDLTTVPLIQISNPKYDSKIPIPFKNKQIFRYFNDEEHNFNKNYYLEYINNSLGSLNSNQFSIIHNGIASSSGISGVTIISGINYIENNFKEITTNSNRNLKFISFDNTEKITFTQDLTKMYPHYTNINGATFISGKKYHIRFGTYRPPITVDELSIFSGDQTYDKTQYISKYSTLGIFERMLDEQINSFFKTISYNLIKASELYRTYSSNIFRNRIIKLKVCPIDDKGFCYENYSEDYSISTETDIHNRSIAGFSKKLFPYHEYDIIKSYDKSEFGRTVNIIGTPYKSYRRAIQSLDNKEQSSKQFLPGMGVYIINSEKAASGFRTNNTHYNVTNTPKNVSLYYSEYEYSTQFIGYVVDTSINSKQEYNRNYRLNSDQFSKVTSDKSIYSEYYIYMLIDPTITSSSEIKSLFNSLNRDNINIVFDGNAKEDYSNTPLKTNGYVTSKNEFFVDSVTNTHLTKSDDKQYSIPKNIYGQRSFLNELNVLNIYENETYTQTISPNKIDAFLNLTASAISIKKPKLNNTLPYYNFQTRIACATITQRPVAYEERDNINSRGLFHSAEYDYFYKNYMENKTVMKYKPLIDSKNIDTMNKHNMIIDNPIKTNFKSQNFKETNCHSLTMDPNINTTIEYYNIPNNTTHEYNTVPGCDPILNFNNGDDIILVDSYKQKFAYENGENNYNEIKGREDNKLGIPHDHIKILNGSILPELYFDHHRLFDNQLNEYLSQTCILENEYESGLERLTKNMILGKYKPKSINIVGNKSIDYNRVENDDIELYNKVFVKNINNNKTITITNNINLNVIDPSTLKDCLFIIDTNIKLENQIQPIDNTNNCELGIIKEAHTNSNTDLTIELYSKLRSEHKNNITDSFMRACISYPTIIVSYTSSPKIFNIETSDIINPRIDSIKKDSYIIFDWGNNLMCIRKIVSVFKQNNNATITIDEHPNNILNDTESTRIIILNNHITQQSSTVPRISQTLLSTQPFTINNEWYTRVFYRGGSYKLGEHFDFNYTKSHIFPFIKSNRKEIKNCFVEGGTPFFHKNYSNTVFIGGMKGIKIPFVHLPDTESNINTDDSRVVSPFDDDYYEVVPEIKPDFMIDQNSAPYILPIPGEFKSNLDSINNSTNFDINESNQLKWEDDSDILYNYPYIVIKGLYLGYGGFIEERASQDTINTIVNKSNAFSIKKVTKINNKFFIYLQLTSSINNIMNKSNLSTNYNILNQCSRQNYLDYETNLNILDDIFTSDEIDNYESHLSIFGKDGKMVRKVIKNPYNLNPDNYIYLVIPNLNHIKSVQNNNIDGAFAKLLLPGDSTGTLFSSFVAGTKIYYNNLFNNLSELEITFITNDGYLFDFNGSEHSFAIEITEIIDKFEYINPRYGNIEI